RRFHCASLQYPCRRWRDSSRRRHQSPRGPAHMTRWRRLGAVFLVAAVPALAAQRADSYGAIAYGPKTSSWGDANGANSAQDAKQRALSFCARGGSDCRVVASFSNTCAAVAVVEANDATFVATNEKRGNAENLARQACSQKNHSGCRVADSICSQR